MTRREELSMVYESGVSDVLDYLIEKTPNVDDWQNFIKEVGKAFNVEVYTLEDLLEELPD